MTNLLSVQTVRSAALGNSSLLREGNKGNSRPALNCQQEIK